MTRGQGHGTQRRSREEAQAYLGLLVDYFAGLLAAGRGDSARAWGLHALLFFEYVWSNPQLPLHSHRPSRRPAAFLAMVFDLVGDASGEYTQRLLGGDEARVRRELAERLTAPWRGLLAQLRGDGFVCLARVLDETLRTALRHPGQSDLPAYLARLRLYMTPAELRRVEVPLLLETLSVAEVFDYLRFSPRGPRRADEELHPASGDLLQAIRAAYDPLWAAALSSLEPGPVTLLAALPVDALALLQTAEAVPEDFAVFYARTTDAHAPGRSWRPPPQIVAPDDWSDFTFLAARGARDSLPRAGPEPPGAQQHLSRDRPAARRLARAAGTVSRAARAQALAAEPSGPGRPDRPDPRPLSGRAGPAAEPGSGEAGFGKAGFSGTGFRKGVP